MTTEQDDHLGTAPELQISEDKTQQYIKNSSNTEADSVARGIEPENQQPANNQAKSSWYKNLWSRFCSIIRRPIFWWSLLSVVMVSVLIGVFVPKVRYFVLNTVGVRASSSIIIVDSATRLPVKNVVVTIGQQSSRTDIDGKAVLRDIKLGEQRLKVSKSAFATEDKTVVIGWGSNPLDNIALRSTGYRYTFVTLDFLTNKPITNAEVSYGESSALSDGDGRVMLIVEKPEEEFEVTITAKSYRTDKYKIQVDNSTDKTVKMVSARKHLFVSRRSGKPDLYSSYLDGKDLAMVLTASGAERDDQVLAPHPSKDAVAYSSTRGNQKNSDGYLLSNLIIVDTTNNQTSLVSTSEQMYVVGWSGDWLVYAKITSGASAPNPERQQLHKYNIETREDKTIASANYFNSFRLVGDHLLFAINGQQNPSSAKLESVNIENGDKVTILNGEIWGLIVFDQNEVAFQSGEKWYNYKAGDKSPTDRSDPVNQSRNRVYINNQQNSVWLDKRDGMGVLLLRNNKIYQEETLFSKKHVEYPVSWFDDNTVIYRVVSPEETADYALNINGGQAIKITDVSNTKGVYSF